MESLISLADEMLDGKRTEKTGVSCGEWLGKGLSVLIDVLNPERVVIGSIFARSEGLLRAGMKRVINKEALPRLLPLRHWGLKQ